MATLKRENNKKTLRTSKISLEKREMLELYKKMFLIRQFELACGENYTKGNIRGFLHLYIGQEATAVGSISNLRTSPSAPQVDLVSNCEPSVISTFIEW